MSNLQAERWLAAEPVVLTSGTASNITLRASSDLWVDLRRLIIQIGAYKGSATAHDTHAVMMDSNFSTKITSLLVKDAIQLVRGSSSPSVSASRWSPRRSFGSMPLGKAGDYLFMASGETIVAELTQTSGIESIAAAAVPCFLAVDKGRPYLPGGYSPDQATTGLGSDPSSGSASSNTADINGHTVTYSEAGVAYLHLMECLFYETEQTVSTGGPQNQNLVYGSYVSSIKGVQSDQYVIGTPDNSGNAVGVPAAAFFPAGTFSSWCRLPAMPGSSANTISVSGTCYGGNSLANVALAVDLPFQATNSAGVMPVCL